MSKVIVITGAGVGLGRAVAKRFVSEGHQVALLGRTYSKVEAATKEIGEASMAVECDIAVPESVNKAFAAVAEKHGRIDVLINNAAIFEPYKIANARDDQILSTIATNLGGPMLCTREVLKSMGKGGHIINVTSESVEMPFPHLSVYQASKAGLERFSKSMQQELDPQGIRVTNVRAGQMYEEGKTWDVPPEDRAEFGKAAIAAGINLLERPLSQFESVCDIFSALINLPADLQAVSINLQARKAD